MPAARIGLLFLAAFLVVHGLTGPEFAPKNLTTLFVWVHYRGLLILAILLAGNLFCGACPLVLVRDIGRKLITPKRAWPGALKNKWLSAALFVTVLFLYERFALWSWPAATAILILAFFVGILAVDLTFKKASFCKYVCPIGQFNFLASYLSPRSVQARSLDVCRRCTTLDCIKGSSASRGCELNLFVPKKQGALNCTLCMDCARACPHENVVLGPSRPAEALFEGGRLFARPDLVFLQVVFLFGAVLNAFAMVGPAYTVAEWLSVGLGTRSETGVLAALFALFLLVLPGLFLLAAGFWSRAFALGRGAWIYLLPGLIPLGTGIWAAHYGFHFLTGPLTFLPVLWGLLPLPQLDPLFWSRVPMGFSSGSVLPLQIGILLLSLVVTLATIYQRARFFSGGRILVSAAPWWALGVALTAFAAWIFSLPMEMRGTFIGGG